ncbi:winged helix-turn-helix domain-containing protein, partial [Bacillus altitudinis]|uniref:winged helix-turn-helix domain-containing protein n=1 Tax=Bacillus altitudinis TaxID=293387 RepID=UPI0023546DA9
MNLTTTQFHLLIFLLLNQPQLFSPQHLYQKFSQSHSPTPSLTTLHTHIKTLTLK